MLVMWSAMGVVFAGIAYRCLYKEMNQLREQLRSIDDARALLAFKLSVMENVNEQWQEDNDRLAKELCSKPSAPYGLPSWGDWVQKSVIDAKLDQGYIPVKIQGEWVFAMPIDEREVVSVLGPSLVGPPSHLRESLQCDPIFSEPSPN